MTTIDDFTSGFLEEPGYLDYARIGPLSAAVLEELAVQNRVLSRARFGSLDALGHEGGRMRAAVSELTGFASDQIVFQPNTGSGLMHALFGITGGVLLAASEFPSLTFAAARAAEALQVVEPIWLDTDHGRVTPGQIRAQLTDKVAAVAVSLVDFRTGYLADIDGIRQVIGDRLLIVDAIQGFGVVDAPYQVADVVASGGQKWTRAGGGTGFLALSERAIERILPVLSGSSGTDGGPLDEVTSAARGARAFSISTPDAVAEARFAAALEEIAEVGVGEVQARVAVPVAALIDLADEFAIPVVSPRDESERAGIVVLEPPTGTLTLLTASLFNVGVSATTRQDRVRLSAHVGTGADTLAMVRAALVSYLSAAR